MKEILAQIKQYKKDSILTPVFTALEVFMEMLLPFIMAKIIDDGIEKGNMTNVYIFGGVMVVAAMVSLLSGFLAGKYAASASSGFACNLREAIYRKVQTYSFSNIDKFSTAGLVTRMTTDVTNVQNAYQMIIRIAVRAPLMLICSMAMCFAVSGSMSIIFLAAIVLLGIVLGIIVKKTMKVFTEAFKKYDDLNASIQENVSAIRVVKAYVREDFEQKKFKKASGNLYKMFVKAESLIALNNPVMMFVIYSCVMLISWLGAKNVVAGTMKTGELSSVFTYVISAMMSLMMLSMVFLQSSRAMASIRRIDEVLDEPIDLSDENASQKDRKVEKGRVEFKDVSFSYREGGEPVLSHISLTAEPGETIGILGATGSGKTSLVQLIPRLYDVTEGSVRVDGIDVREYSLKNLRDGVGMVLQKNVLFSGTIEENLRWGDETATEEEVRRAAVYAQADSFVNSFAEGYKTEMGQGGVNVSGGQKQRLCIARALLKKPKILILDDSTSAVDTATEAAIRTAFREDLKDTTKFIIAQRLSSLEYADRILVLEDGRIIGEGTQEKLLASCEAYREIYETQYGKRADGEGMA